jgi:dolichol-phosphate mannosyltransferase
MKKPKQKLVIIPTYNEAANITELIREIFLYASDVHVLVIDDNSPDGTGTIVQNLRADYPGLKMLKRRRKLGLASAYRLGFAYALEKNYDYIIEMDADFSHDPVVIAQFLQEINNHDLVIGSRYITGGRLVNWPLFRLALSYFASLYVRLITGLPVHDATAGYKCFRRCVLKSVDLDNMLTDGYAFQIEMHFRAWQNGWRIKEIPITFVDRSAGQSKLNGGIIWEAIWLPWKLRLAPLLEYINIEEEKR